LRLRLQKVIALSAAIPHAGEMPAFRDIRYHRWRTFLLKCVYHDIQQVLGFDI
jgi:hypothetical protein